MPVKILMVDDDEVIRLFVKKVFRSFDCELFEARNGMEGLAVAARELPNLIILDVAMPVMDGVEALSRLKSNSALKAIPVIMLTAESGREGVMKIAQLGVRDYVVKPFKEEQLIEKAGRLVNLQERSQPRVVKTINDPVSILMVDDKPAIVRQVKEALATTSWKIEEKATIVEAMEAVNCERPDVILLNLALNDDAAATLFRQLRSVPKTRAIPVLGMCVKTDQESQSRAEQMGFNGVITKPIDVEALHGKLCRIMNLDTSPLYFSTGEGILFLTLPPKVTNQVTIDLGRYLDPKIHDMVNTGMNKLILDLSKIMEIDVSMIKTIIATMENCQKLSIKIRIVGSAVVSRELKGFQETSSLTIYSTVEEAKARLEAP